MTFMCQVKHFCQYKVMKVITDYSMIISTLLCFVGLLLTGEVKGQEPSLNSINYEINFEPISQIKSIAKAVLNMTFEQQSDYLTAHANNTLAKMHIHVDSYLKFEKESADSGISDFQERILIFLEENVDWIKKRLEAKAELRKAVMSFVERFKMKQISLFDAYYFIESADFIFMHVPIYEVLADSYSFDKSLLKYNFERVNNIYARYFVRNFVKRKRPDFIIIEDLIDPFDSLMVSFPNIARHELYFMDEIAKDRIVDELVRVALPVAYYYERAQDMNSRNTIIDNLQKEFYSKLKNSLQGMDNSISFYFSKLLVVRFLSLVHDDIDGGSETVETNAREENGIIGAFPVTVDRSQIIKKYKLDVNQKVLVESFEDIKDKMMNFRPNDRGNIIYHYRLINFLKDKDLGDDYFTKRMKLIEILHFTFDLPEKKKISYAHACEKVNEKFRQAMKTEDSMDYSKLFIYLFYVMLGDTENDLQLNLSNLEDDEESFINTMEKVTKMDEFSLFKRTNAIASYDYTIVNEIRYLASVNPFLSRLLITFLIFMLANPIFHQIIAYILSIPSMSINALALLIIWVVYGFLFLATSTASLIFRVTLTILSSKLCIFSLILYFIYRKNTNSWIRSLVS
ncbi:hypothetical protein ROZALSC1DRAFT_24751 [Rozella allomycis CSF55]|uniref:Uncharacterized protein n=1 Tax=Rozella allomycis (strain CSF55) TaxID=988480 RepID=A0A4P9YE41_ROZAC|nr:hypothetical protein ROZALSC1DRAFT_24751 [Rozella allomycis CSF55]